MLVGGIAVVLGLGARQASSSERAGPMSVESEGVIIAIFLAVAVAALAADS